MESSKQKQIADLIRWLAHPKMDKALRARRRLIAIGPSTLDQLIEATKSPVVNMRLHAMIALAYIGDRRAYDAILGMTHDQDRFVRYESAWALAKLGDVRALGPLIELMQSNDDGGAASGAISFIHLVGKPAVKPLIEVLHSGSKEARASAAYCLAHIGGDCAFEAIAELLNHPDEELRHAAVESLSNLSETRTDECAERALELIEKHLDDGSKMVRQSADFAIEEIWKAQQARPFTDIPKPWQTRLLVGNKRKDERLAARSKRMKHYKHRRKKHATH